MAPRGPRRPFGRRRGRLGRPGRRQRRRTSRLAGARRGRAPERGEHRQPPGAQAGRPLRAGRRTGRGHRHPAFRLRQGGTEGAGARRDHRAGPHVRLAGHPAGTWHPAACTGTGHPGPALARGARLHRAGGRPGPDPFRCDTRPGRRCRHGRRTDRGRAGREAAGHGAGVARPGRQRGHAAPGRAGGGDPLAGQSAGDPARGLGTHPAAESPAGGVPPPEPQPAPHALVGGRRTRRRLARLQLHARCHALPGPERRRSRVSGRHA